MLSNKFALMVRVQGDVSTDEMAAALNKVRVRHPALVVGAEQTPFPLFIRVDGGENGWIEVIQTELAEPFPSEPGPFATFTLLKHADYFDLVGVFHHHVCDGMSGMFVMRDILQVLGTPDLSLSPLPMPPPEEMLVPQAVSANPGFRRKLEMTVMQLRVRVLLEKLRMRFMPRKQAASVSENPQLQNQFLLLHARLTVSQTAALVARCKNKQVSVHAAVCVAWLRALIGESEKGKPRKKGTVSSPVNLRQRVSPPIDDTSGGFLTIVETSVNCAPEKDFWEVAREFKQRFAQDTRDEVLFFKTAMFIKAFTELPRADLNILADVMFSGPVNYDFSITNLGRIPIPEHNGKLNVQAFYGPLVNSSPYERTVGVSTLAGQASFSFLFRKSMMDPASGQALMDRAVKILLDASGVDHVAG